MKATATRTERKTKPQLTEHIANRLIRRYSTVVVLFHHAVAERLGMGPTDHKCLDLLRERQSLTGSELAALTGLTSGAVTGVVARLEQAGFVDRQPDPNDGRKQILCASPERIQDIRQVFDPIRKDMMALLQRLDVQQLEAIAEFLTQSTDLAYRHTALLRSDSLHREA